MKQQLHSSIISNGESHEQLREVDSGEGIWVLLLATVFVAVVMIV